jgi:serine/threonine protein kinase/predicted Zn-dependent protease
MALPPGTRLGSYVVLAPLGAGGMGEVYKARDEKLNRLVALKIVHTAGATDPGLRDRFQREARSIAALTHPNIVTIHSIEEHDGTPFLTMEFVEGKTLAELIRPGGLPLQRFLELAIPLADAVAAAHARGITHRDLKPANVMVTADGRLKVLDFGLAKLTERPDGAGGLATLTTEQLTDAGQIVGTRAYMSPEQAEGKPVTHRSDIFSLGIILYELATGRRPFTGDSPASLVSSILRDAQAPIGAVNAGIPREVERLIRRCLEKDPADRLQSALDLKHALEDLRSDVTPDAAVSSVDKPSARDVPSTSARRVSTRWLVAAAAFLVLAAIVSFGWTRWRTSPSVSDETGSTGSAPVTLTRFENRTGDPSLDPVGQMAVDAVAQELPHLGDVMQGGGSGYVPITGSRARTMQRRAAVKGAYYLDGQNLRIQASLSSEPGTVVYAIEPALAPRDDPGKAVDLVQQRTLGAIVAWLDPDLGRMIRPPLYSAYREFKAGYAVFADDSAKAIEHSMRATELDPGFFAAWYQMALAYRNLGDLKNARATVEKMSAMTDRWSPAERAKLSFLAGANEGRLLDALKALREAEKLEPDDLSTNYLIGFYTVRLNRPQETIDEYNKVNADAWNEVTVGAWRYARLATANHLLGRHDEELRVATIARQLYPSSVGSRTDELSALAALGRMDDLGRAIDETLTIAASGPATPGAAIRAAAEELRAHGHRSESIALASRAVSWYRSRPSDLLTAASNRFALATSLYVAEEWAAAGAIASALIKEQPENSAYLALAGAIAARTGDRGAAMKQAAALGALASEPDGNVELRRAQLAALLGQREEAVELLRDAFARGLYMSTFLHRQMDLESLLGFAPFDELMKPKG